MMLWFTVFAVCVTGALVLAAYGITLVADGRRRAAIPIVAISQLQPPAVEELRVSPSQSPPPAVPPSAFAIDEDAATTLAAKYGNETTALARPYNPARPALAKTVVRQVIAYRPTRPRPAA